MSQTGDRVSAVRSNATDTAAVVGTRVSYARVLLRETESSVNNQQRVVGTVGITLYLYGDDALRGRGENIAKVKENRTLERVGETIA